MFAYREVFGGQEAFRRFRNSYLQARWLFPLVVRDRHYEAVLSGGLPGTKVNRALARLLWFWPRVSDAVLWAQGDVGRDRDPENFKQLTSAAMLLIDTIEKGAPDRDTKILDLGCNMGRHLVELHRRGYRSLTGVDVMSAALKAFADQHPRAWAVTTVHHDLFQRFLSKAPDNSYDLVFTHGATVELVHPSFDIVAQLCRTTRDQVVLMIQEYGQGYPRFWAAEFARHGFLLTRLVRPLSQDLPESKFVGASLLVFRRLH